MKSTAGREGRRAAGILTVSPAASVPHPHIGNESRQLIVSWELPGHFVGSDVRPGWLLSALGGSINMQKVMFKIMLGRIESQTHKD